MLEVLKCLITLGCFGTWVSHIIPTIHSSPLSPVLHCGWVGYTDHPECPAALSQPHASSLQVMGFEVGCPAGTGQVERGEELRGPLRSHLTFRMGHMGCAGLSALETFTLLPWTLHCISISYLFKTFFLLLSKFISPNTKKS